MVSLGLLFAFFYNVVVSWSMWYLFASFQSTLPWSNCNHDYNSQDCNVNVSPAQEYWNNNVLGAVNKDWSNFVSTDRSSLMIGVVKNVALI